MLRSLQPSHLRSVAQAVVGCWHRPGGVIYREGEAATHFYVVIVGEVVLSETEAAAASTPAEGTAPAAAAGPGAHQVQVAASAAAAGVAEAEMRHCGPRECFGDGELLQGRPREQSARCVFTMWGCV